MVRAFLAAVFAVSQIFVTFSQAQACSVFAAGDSAGQVQVTGKSFDWLMSHGIALINKRNVEKKAMLKNDDTPATWISQFGSLTYTQMGREFPLSGMNEKGLVVEILWDYDNPGPNGKGNLPALNEAQWIQYILDTSATVPEAEANARKVKVKKVYAEVHYMVCDVSGACSTFEFRGDQLVINSIAQAELKVLTNSDYSKSVNFAQDYIGFGGKNAVPYGSYKSLDRFVILASQIKQLTSYNTSTEAVPFAFSMLRTVRSANSSVWNIVHEQKSLISHFKRMFEASKTMTTRLTDFDLSCKTPVKIFDIESGLDGDVTAEYADYDPVLNRATVELSGKGLGIDKATVDAVVDYPNSTRCTEP